MEQQPGSPAQARLVGLLHALLGSHVQVAARNQRAALQGVLAAAPDAPVSHKLALRLAQAADASQSQTDSLFDLAELVQLDAINVRLESDSANVKAAFQTDADLARASRKEHRERELQSWSADVADSLQVGALEGALDHSSSSATWDQFAANERLYGAASTYDEDNYTTRLDRTAPDFVAKERKAAQVAAEILKGQALADNAHMAEERNIKPVGQDSNEEDKYGAVLRGDNAYIPPAARRGAPAATTTATIHSKPSVTPPTAQKSDASTTGQPSIKLTEAERPSPPPGPLSHQSDKRRPDGPPPQREDTLIGTFRQFVSNEKERLAHKKQALAKDQEKKDQDTRLASLLEFSQSFKLKSPCPSDLAQMLGKDGAEGLVVHHGGESNAVQASANSPDSQRPATGESQGNAGAATKPASAQSTINPLARPFTSKLNPNTTAFMPSTSRPPASSPSPGPLTTSAPRERVVSPGPQNLFFGDDAVKRGPPGMHVKEDFSPYRAAGGANLPIPASLNPNWPFSGKSYKAGLPVLAHAVMPMEEDQSVSLPPASAPTSAPYAAGYPAFRVGSRGPMMPNQHQHLPPPMMAAAPLPAGFPPNVPYQPHAVPPGSRFTHSGGGEPRWHGNR